MRKEPNKILFLEDHTICCVSKAEDPVIFPFLKIRYQTTNRNCFICRIVESERPIRWRYLVHLPFRLQNENFMLQIGDSDSALKYRNEAFRSLISTSAINFHLYPNSSHQNWNFTFERSQNRLHVEIQRVKIGVF